MMKAIIAIKVPCRRESNFFFYGKKKNQDHHAMLQFITSYISLRLFVSSCLPYYPHTLSFFSKCPTVTRSLDLYQYNLIGCMTIHASRSRVGERELKTEGVINCSHMTL